MNITSTSHSNNDRVNRMDHGDMTMATTTAAMAATGTMSGMSAATSTKAAMSMGGSGCKISMLWNWTTIGSCYISSSVRLPPAAYQAIENLVKLIITQWKITSNGMFAGSCIGVILLVMCLELLRRTVKEYDRYLIRQHKASFAAGSGAISPNSENAGIKGAAASVAPVAGAAIPPFRPNVLQQAVRALLHMCQFAVAYFVMLLAMYYNGYIIICIFIGSYLGSFIFQWETLFDVTTSATSEATVCCG
ncbi:copper transporter ctr4 [Colletotrichum karsti]|uniref:Copper transport protein n=1 Tax=Colletotrichum karsti TaxID=1095194 RepID=A0A9P6I1L0_9PEZI|nr:copper transporter ctr4 [Colletotrichum karsti]KAF9870220.1 copper transporter ctr4 [Colletotrichum karsti]